MGKLRLAVELDMEDDPSVFGDFCAAMIAAGFGDQVRAIAKELLAEAERRNLPIAKELKETL